MPDRVTCVKSPAIPLTACVHAHAARPGHAFRPASSSATENRADGHGAASWADMYVSSKPPISFQITGFTTHSGAHTRPGRSWVRTSILTQEGWSRLLAGPGFCIPGKFRPPGRLARSSTAAEAGGKSAIGFAAAVAERGHQALDLAAAAVDTGDVVRPCEAGQFFELPSAVLALVLV